MQVYRRYCDNARLTPSTVAIYVPRVTEILEFFADEDGWQLNVCSLLSLPFFHILIVNAEQDLVDLRGGQPRLLPSLARYPMAARHPTAGMQQHVVNSFTSICRVTNPFNQICDTCGYTCRRPCSGSSSTPRVLP